MWANHDDDEPAILDKALPQAIGNQWLSSTGWTGKQHFLSIVFSRVIK